MNEMVNPLWVELSDSLVCEMEEGIPIRDSHIVQYTMTIGSSEITKKQTDFVHKFFHRWKFTDPTEINHAYHYCQYVSFNPWVSPNVIVEWGAGYGAMAKVMKTIFPYCEYHCIDLPGPQMAQKKFLAGLPGVHFWGLDELDGVPAGDTFISTWALSESTKIAQDYVVDGRRWFGCQNLLLAFQPTKGKDGFPDAAHFSTRVEQEGLTILPVPVYDGDNFYAFR